MKFKIQIGSVCGWSDLKESEDDGETYKLCLYETEEEAIAEAKWLEELEHDWRVVPDDVKEDFNLY